MLIILHFYPLLLFFVLLINPLNQCHEVLLNEVLFLSHLDLQPLEILFDHCSVLPNQFYLVIELCQFIQDLVFVLLVYLAQMDDLMRAVLC